MSSFYWLFVEVKENFSRIFLFSEMSLSEAAILAYEQKQKIFKMPPTDFDLYVISFIYCTNFETFTTFSAILHVCAVP